ncbi:UDP-glucose 4-epimerase GalE [Primorskyibacter sp. S187A]|uniref:UDP-glucose 4-epimerase GalE n=1 Tax=Primorskyibacter sp. S187A TaxID=3415130 RepID=UPI003C7E78B6
MRVLVTGGAGYIGTHTLLELVAAGHEPFVVDNFENASPRALARVGELIQRPIPHATCDVRDRSTLTEIFEDIRPEAVIHFAGLKAVGESEERPRDYYDVNVAGTLTLLAAMEAVDCARIVFSSSATVYGAPDYLPYDEAHPTRPLSVYAKTKLMAEDILRDWHSAHPQSAVLLLRYFNPVGAHISGRIGEDPQGWPNNLMPFITQVAVGRRDKLMVFGDDYDTPDGTGVRDYIHVVDLARAHVAALTHAEKTPGAEVINIGTGQGYSVLEMIRAFEAATGLEIPHEIAPRREGDIAAMQADVRRAETLLGWRARHGLAEMMASAWGWQSANPQGYTTDN